MPAQPCPRPQRTLVWGPLPTQRESARPCSGDGTAQCPGAPKFPRSPRWRPQVAGGRRRLQARKETEGNRGGAEERGAAGQGPGQGQAERRSPSSRGGWHVLSGAGREGQCHLAPGNRRHFLGADRPVVGGAVPTELATRQRGGRGVCGQRRPSHNPSALAATSGPGPGWESWGLPRLGRAWAGAGMLPPRLGRSLPPPGVLPCPGAHPSVGSVPILGPWDPRAIARPP